MDLFAAAYLGKFEDVKNYIENDHIEVNHVDDAGDSALHIACSKGRFEIIQYLVQKGANVNLKNIHGSTPLHKSILAKYPS
jgi:ankyrin repeat protein